MARYRVKPGMTFGPGGVYKAGAVVELAEEEAKAFLDKLIPLDEKQAAVEDPAPGGDAPPPASPEPETFTIQAEPEPEPEKSKIQPQAGPKRRTVRRPRNP